MNTMNTRWGQGFHALRWLLITALMCGLVSVATPVVHAVTPRTAPPCGPVAPDSVVVEASPTSPASQGTSVTFTAKVNSIPCAVVGGANNATGSVTFELTGATTRTSASTPLTEYNDPTYGSGGGMATYTVSDLAPGVTHAVIHYSGRSDGMLTPADSAPLDYTITGTTASTTSLVATSGAISSPPASMLTVASGDSVSFTATVAATSGAPMATPTGTVQFLDGTAVIGSGPLSGGTATFSTTTLMSGSHSITAMYLGDATYATSTSSPPITVSVSGSLTPITTTLSANPTSPSTTQPFTLTATVTTTAGGTPVATGSVTFSENGATLATVNVNNSGVATYTSTGTFAAGSHTVLATYSGDTTYATSNVSTTFTMTTIAVSTTGTASPASIASSFGLGLSVNVTATGVTFTGVSVDLSAIGLGVVPLTHASGSTTWRSTVTIPANAPVGGPYSLPVTLTDSTNTTYNGTPLAVTITREVQSLSITPGGDAHIIAGSSQTFGLTASYTNGTSAPVSTGAIWTVSDTHVATVDGNGRVTAGTAGTTTLTATFGGRSTRVTISVVAGGNPTVPPVVPRPAVNPLPHQTAPTPVGGATPLPAPTRH